MQVLKHFVYYIVLLGQVVTFSRKCVPMHKALPNIMLNSIKHSESSFQNFIKMFSLLVHEALVLI